MASSVHPATRARAGGARSMSSDRRTGRRLRTALVLARTSLLVLAGRASVSTACGSSDGHRVEPGDGVGRRLAVVLAGSTVAIGREGDRAFIAAREAITGGTGTASTPSDVGPLQQQQLLSRRGSAAVRVHTGSLDWPPQAAEGRPLGVRRAAMARQTVSSTLVVAGLIGLLGMYGTAALIVQSVTGRVGRAVRGLQAPETAGRRHRPRPTTRHDLHDMSRVAVPAGEDPLEAAREIGADVPSPSMAAHLVALDTAIEGARSGGADTGSALIAPRRQEPAEAPTKAAEAGSPLSTPAGSSVVATRYAAARSRALGPTTALWHAVELDRLVGSMGGACETTVCGSLVRVSAEQRWPVPARDVCPACSTLAH